VRVLAHGQMRNWRGIPKPHRSPTQDVPTYYEMLLRQAGIIPPPKAARP